MSEKIFTSGADFYRTLKDRRLHLRKNNGRDSALEAALKSNLHCNNMGLQKFLSKSRISAENFLLEFLKVAHPFVQMFEEILNYLSSHVATRSDETLAIQFSFDGSKKPTNIDLETFRRYVESARTTLAPVHYQRWNSNALGGLFQLSDILLPNQNEYLQSTFYGYNTGQSLKLPAVKPGKHPIDMIVVDIANLFQGIIDNARDLSKEQLAHKQLGDNNKSIRNRSLQLTDLLPRWVIIFNNLNHIPTQLKDKGLAYFIEKIRPLLQIKEKLVQTKIRETLDILDLPFWKHRWHTYEVWATVKCLEALKEYKPVPRITNGKVGFDGSTSEIIADLKVRNYPNATVAVQVQTSYKNSGKRKGVKPDLRVCFSDKVSDASETAAIVEFKQRLQWHNIEHFEEVLESYEQASPQTGGVIIINYDEPGISPKLSAKGYYIEGLQPGYPENIRFFNGLLANNLTTAGFIAPVCTRVILLDISVSMGAEYSQIFVDSFVKELQALKDMYIYFFNDRLIAGSIHQQNSIELSGGTDLVNTLKELKIIHTYIDKLLIVTDGDYDNPDFRQWPIAEIKKCKPKEFDVHKNWISQ